MRKYITLVLTALLLAACASVMMPEPFAAPADHYPAGTTVALVGDLQRTSLLEFWRETNNPERYSLIRQIAMERPSVLVTLGDHVFYGSSDDDWRYLDRAMTPIRKAGIPVLPILGNHEYFGSDEAMLEHYRQRFPSFASTYYSMVIDSVAYVMLNTNYRDIGMKAMSVQHRWYLVTMYALDRDPSVQFIVVCGHHPPFTNSTVVDDDDILQSYFVPAFVHSRKGAIWFSGHCHAYEHFFYDMKHFVVSGGGGGPRQHLLTGSYAQHADHYEGGMIRPMHYCTLRREGDVLTFAMHPLATARSEPADTFGFKRR